MKASDLVGVWKLESCEGRSAGGQMFAPYGERPQGKLIYTAQGHISVILANSTRRHFASEDISKAASEEVVAAFESFDAYSGRWTFDEAAAIVTHRIEAGRIPNWVGREHRRWVHMHEELLTLTTDEFSMGGDSWRVSVSWSRVNNETAICS